MPQPSLQPLRFSHGQAVGWSPVSPERRLLFLWFTQLPDISGSRRLTLPVPRHHSILLLRQPLLQILNPLILVCPHVLAGLEFLNFLNSFLPYIYIYRASLVAQTLKHLPAMRETQVPSLGREDSLEKEMATHSSILAWEIPRTEESLRLQFMGSQRVAHDWVTSVYIYIYSRSFICMSWFITLHGSSEILLFKTLMVSQTSARQASGSFLMPASRPYLPNLLHPSCSFISRSTSASCS